MAEGAAVRRRSGWPYHGRRQTHLLFAALAVLAGNALPWVVILGKALWGSPGAITWTLWAGIMVLAAAAVRPRPLVVLSALVGGGAAIVFAVWQTTRLVTLCGVTVHCVPGPGLGLLLIGGVGAVVAVWGIVRDRATA